MLMNGKRTGLTLFSALLALFLFSGLLVFYATPADAKPKEREYQTAFCEPLKGETEHVLSDKTRVDCLTDEYAIEVEFSRKWAEAIGQSLFYSLHTGKKAGIALIVKGNKEYKYFIRLNSTIEHFKLPITVWKIDA